MSDMFKNRDEQIKQAAIERGCIEGTAEYYGFIEGARYADQNQQNPWISVEERLPKGHEYVFFRKKDSAKYYGWFDERMQLFFTIDPEGTRWTIYGVTHWMPISELKKGGEQ